MLGKISIYSFLVLTFLSFSCGGTKEDVGEVRSSSIIDKDAFERDKRSHQSVLKVPVNFPIADLEVAVNKALPPVLLEETLELNKGGDKLFLKISTLGKMTLASRGEKLYSSIPISIEAVIEKNVLGMKFGNKQPLEFSMLIGLETAVRLEDDWSLSTKCRITNKEWIEEPEMKVLMVNVNLKKLVDRQIEKNKRSIEEAICSAITGYVPIRSEIEKIWGIINTAHLIAKNPVRLWLDTKPTKFSGSMDREAVDTLRVNVGILSDISISPAQPAQAEIPGLPVNPRNSFEAKGLDLNVRMNIPIAVLNQIIEHQIVGKKLTYGGYSITVSEAESRIMDDKIAMDIIATGDIDFLVHVDAKPSLSKAFDLEFHDINYTLTSENQLINVTDWLTNSSFTEYINQSARISLANVLSTLDQKIITALNKSKTGTILGLDIRFDKIESDIIIYRANSLNWYFNVEGDAALYLNEKIVH